MTNLSDIVYASGAVHDDAGPITSFAGVTDAGRDWIAAYGAGGSYVIEDHMLDYTLACIASDGLTVGAA